MQSPENYPQGGDAQRPNWPWLVNGAICFAAFALVLFICQGAEPTVRLAIRRLPQHSDDHGSGRPAVLDPREEGADALPPLAVHPLQMRRLTRPTGRVGKIRTSQCCTG